MTNKHNTKNNNNRKLKEKKVSSTPKCKQKIVIHSVFIYYHRLRPRFQREYSSYVLRIKYWKKLLTKKYFSNC